MTLSVSSIISIVCTYKTYTTDRIIPSRVCVCVQGGRGCSCQYNRAFFIIHYRYCIHMQKKLTRQNTFFHQERGLVHTTAPFLIEVPVIYQQSERSMISVLGCNGFASVSTMFNFNSSDGVISFCFSLFS